VPTIGGKTPDYRVNKVERYGENACDLREKGVRW
jgi:hypothetical protein